ncbi:MAG: LCP family protein [Candidatus Azambacteria bacterium]|nr:LCP family protein [Candidatus Azambacteria bacterium]
MNFSPPPFYTPSERPQRKSWKKRIALGVIVFAVIVPSFLLFKVEKTFSLINTRVFGKTFHIEGDNTAHREENRINILLMGLRGETGEDSGDYLTDTIIVLSIKTDQEKAALFSIPRDLYVRIPGYNKMEKINHAYAYGMQTQGDGLRLATLTVQRVSGIEIDHAVAVDFSTFKGLIDAIGGVDIYVPTDFTESSQWGYEFYVPKGMNHMNSETALYYARSRYSTNDFDRARRQQDIITALGKKIMSLGILANPIAINKTLNTVAAGVRTDIDFISMLGLTRYAKIITQGNLERFVFDDSQNGLLESGHAGKSYILTPRAGMEDYREMKKRFIEVFGESL